MCSYCVLDLMLLDRIRICPPVNVLYQRIQRYVMYCNVSVVVDMCCVVRMDGK